MITEQAGLNWGRLLEIKGLRAKQVLLARKVLREILELAAIPCFRT
jgi:hypothetical protein